MRRARTRRSYDEVLAELQSLENPANCEGMARYGIEISHALGISIYTLREIAAGIEPDHDLAARLWASGIHEAQHLAAMVDEPEKVTEAQIEAWAAEFDSWDICDQVCGNLLLRTPFVVQKAVEWTSRPEEFVKRAGFALMCELAAHDKQAPDELFLSFLPLIIREAGDDRNFVKKAVNWALRNIGKRNLALNAAAIETARQIREQGSRSAKWIAADALRELTSDRMQQRLRK
jgi:3-methyladenine DNA glycosylase AlkD